MSSESIAILHLIDSLDAGGAEQMAVNLVNHLPPERYLAYLCTTRKDGPLSALVRSPAGWLRLKRRSRFDYEAFRRLVRFIGDHRIRLLHAHSSSLFIAVAASLFPPRPAVVWHDHFGCFGLSQRQPFFYRPWLKKVSGIIVVNEALATWSRNSLRMPAAKVWFIPNFASGPEACAPCPGLPGRAGARIVCVANLRPQKDHLTLIRAMAIVLSKAPQARLLLVGSAVVPDYSRSIRQEAERLGIAHYVSFLGRREDVPDVLCGCDIGVLSSASEGLPLALMEYGLAGLPAVATAVGQCAEVLDGGRCGILTPPRNPSALAEALLELLKSPERRALLGVRLRERVKQMYSPEPVIRRVCQVYQTVLGERP